MLVNIINNEFYPFKREFSFFYLQRELNYIENKLDNFLENNHDPELAVDALTALTLIKSNNRRYVTTSRLGKIPNVLSS